MKSLILSAIVYVGMVHCAFGQCLAPNNGLTMGENYIAQMEEKRVAWGQPASLADDLILRAYRGQVATLGAQVRGIERELRCRVVERRAGLFGLRTAYVREMPDQGKRQALIAKRDLLLERLGETVCDYDAVIGTYLVPQKPFAVAATGH